MSGKHHTASARDFGAQVRSNLAVKKIFIIGKCVIPDENGSYARGETGYQMDDNGTGRIWTYADVVEATRRPIER